MSRNDNDREPPARPPGVAWPLAADECPELEATHSLEHVGRILRRLELDPADIVQLRTETRAILAGLAA